MRQISEVTQCGLKRIKSLEFDHRFGGCSNVDDKEIYLCFDDLDTKQCWSGDDPLGKFTKIVPSTYHHRWTSTAASTSKSNVTFICHQ